MGANEHGHVHEGGPQSPTSLGTAGYDLYMTRSVRLYHGLFLVGFYFLFFWLQGPFFFYLFLQKV